MMENTIPTVNEIIPLFDRINEQLEQLADKILTKNNSNEIINGDLVIKMNQLRSLVDKVSIEMNYNLMLKKLFNNICSQKVNINDKDLNEFRTKLDKIIDLLS